jgi:peptidoglycan-associated lipoprotein
MTSHGRIVAVGLLGATWGLACSHEQQVTKQPETPPVAAAPAPAPKQEQPKGPASFTPQPVDDMAYFDLDSALLRDDARPVLQQLADKVKTSRTRVRIEGNCDERGTGEYNLALGAHRAEAAKKYLLSLGVPSSRIETVSYGKERPKYEGHDEASWSKNRRDDFVVKRK